MLYSVPHEYIKRKVDVRVTDKTIEVFYNHNRIASHRRLYIKKRIIRKAVLNISSRYKTVTTIVMRPLTAPSVSKMAISGLLRCVCIKV